jgi:lipoprotein-anchoring transpeptidase ErfK/SrfK
MPKFTTHLKVIALIFVFLFVLFFASNPSGVIHGVTQHFDQQASKVVATKEATSKKSTKASSKSSNKTQQTSTTKKASAKTTASAETKTIDWHASSEDKAYPTLQASDWIDVSEEKQRVYIKHDHQVLYTMYCSTGAPDATGTSATPKGTFEIEAERGLNFFNQASGEGANYWVSFKDHGTYLFHTVPVDANGNYVESEAVKLGKEAASHGCVRLSVADAKWFYETVPTGMKVVIE